MFLRIIWFGESMMVRGSVLDSSRYMSVLLSKCRSPRGSVD